MLTCPVCGETVAAGDAFCERCGCSLRGTGNGDRGYPPGSRTETAPAAPVAPTPLSGADAPCARCGGPVTAGFCGECGLRRSAPGDHTELRLGPAAGVSDRGLRHEHNEDAMALRTVPPADGTAGSARTAAGAATRPAAPVPAPAPASAVAAIVCDGVSSSPRPAAASAAAADAGAAALAESLRDGVGTTEAAGAALRRAGRAVSALADSATSAPACTFLAAAVPAAGGPIGLAWAGDSRAYWVSGQSAAAPSALLTRDDSWREAMVAMNVLSPQEAARSPRAHALTAWLGADYGGAAGQVAAFDPGGAGTLVLCSDGLWNHLPDPLEIAALIRSCGPDPLAAARACIRYALRHGGHDNVTAVLVDVPGPPAAGEVP
ncbi:hypothetical protein GCM10027570_37910 [Streptomonospora sediminis]